MLLYILYRAPLTDGEWTPLNRSFSMGLPSTLGDWRQGQGELEVQGGIFDKVGRSW